MKTSETNLKDKAITSGSFYLISLPECCLPRKILKWNLKQYYTSWFLSRNLHVPVPIRKVHHNVYSLTPLEQFVMPTPTQSRTCSIYSPKYTMTYILMPAVSYISYTGCKEMTFDWEMLIFHWKLITRLLTLPQIPLNYLPWMPLRVTLAGTKEHPCVQGNRVPISAVSLLQKPPKLLSTVFYRTETKTAASWPFCQDFNKTNK